MAMYKLMMLYITNPDKKTAARIARRLLDQRLIAGANIFPINSLYWWQGRLADEKEVVLIAKTLPAKFKQIKKEVEKLHPYQVPCIIKIEAACNKSFYEWLKKEIR
jgi:periplasmic divalent cation tolerance protein